MKDTTFRSVLFGRSDFDVESKGSQVVIKNQVDAAKFKEYEVFLMAMAQLSRLVYCDSGIIREILEKLTKENDFVMKPSDFDTLVESTINQYKELLRKPSTYTNSMDGRPMESYVIKPVTQTGGVDDEDEETLYDTEGNEIPKSSAPRPTAAESSALGVATPPPPMPAPPPALLPVTEPTPAPTLLPVTEPTPAPTLLPVTSPTPAPTLLPVTSPTPAPTLLPVTEPTPPPTLLPVTEPTPSRFLGRYVSSSSDFTFLATPGLYEPTDLVISIKGPSTVENFKTSLYGQFNQATFSSLLAPTGITLSFNAFFPESFVTPIVGSWNEISQTILGYKPTRMFITGHSLGGAYAHILGLILAECRAQMFPTVASVHVVSFGAPTTLTDAARNVFNGHLDSGKLTLDRVVSYARVTRVPDVITTIPIGYSHPGFQPLRTEFFPESRTGRAYYFDMIRKVYQVGGVTFDTEKAKYEQETKTHMPNKIMIAATSPLAQATPHKQYFVTWNTLYTFRAPGMKNPGFNGNTFVADLSTAGVDFYYVPGDTKTAPEPMTQPAENTLTLIIQPTISKPSEGGNHTPRHRNRRSTQRRFHRTR